MTWQFYATAGVVILNLIANVRHNRFAKQAFEKALFNNRTLLSKVLMNIAKDFSTEMAAKTPAPTVEKPIEDAELIDHG